MNDRKQLMVTCVDYGASVATKKMAGVKGNLNIIRNET